MSHRAKELEQAQEAKVSGKSLDEYSIGSGGFSDHHLEQALPSAAAGQLSGAPRRRDGCSSADPQTARPQ